MDRPDAAGGEDDRKLPAKPTAAAAAEESAQDPGEEEQSASKKRKSHYPSDEERKLPAKPPAAAAADPEDKTGEGSQSTPKRRKRRRTGDRRLPRRAMTAYNIFFREERQRILAEREASGLSEDVGSGSAADRKKRQFAEIGRLIAKRWNDLSDKDKEPYKRAASAELVRYEREVHEYEQSRADDRPSGGTEEESSLTATAHIAREPQETPQAQMSSTGAGSVASSLQPQSGSVTSSRRAADADAQEHLRSQIAASALAQLQASGERDLASTLPERVALPATMASPHMPQLQSAMQLEIARRIAELQEERQRREMLMSHLLEQQRQQEEQRLRESLLLRLQQQEILRQQQERQRQQQERQLELQLSSAPSLEQQLLLLPSLRALAAERAGHLGASHAGQLSQFSTQANLGYVPQEPITSPLLDLYLQQERQASEQQAQQEQSRQGQARRDSEEGDGKHSDESAGST